MSDQNLPPQFKVGFPTEFLGEKSEAFIKAELEVIGIELVRFTPNGKMPSIIINGGAVWSVAGLVAGILGISPEDHQKIRQFLVSRIEGERRVQSSIAQEVAEV